VFHKATQALKGSAATSRLKAMAIAGAAAVALVVMASPASATTYFLDKGEMFTPGKATISAPAADHFTTVTAWDGPVLFTANYGTTANTHAEFNFLGFCVDIFDAINIGVDTATTLNLAYHDGPLVNNGEHTAAEVNAFVNLTTLEKNDVSALVNYGTALWNADIAADPTHLHMSNTLIDELAGVQGAIWKVENPTFTIVGATSPYGGTGNAAAVTLDINHYASQAFINTLSVGHMDVVFDSNLPLHQAFAFATTVPEPSTWAMMILGLGGVGVALRRRRAQAAFA
jgi:hypothetical protein